MPTTTAVIENPVIGPPRPVAARSRRALIAAAALAVAVLTYLGAIALNWPFKKQALIDVLQERSVRSVTVNRFYRTYFPPGCVAEGISFLHRKDKSKPPLIRIQKLVLTTSYSTLLTLRSHLSLVRVFGMHVTVPPKPADGSPNPIMPLNYSDSASKLTIDRIVADGAELDFLPVHSQDKSFRLIIDKLALHDVGDNRPMRYRTIISSTVPPGKIRSTGTFGPWNPKNSASVPVAGSYTFSDARLGFFEGIKGTLDSSGGFHGTLGSMLVQGSASVSDFGITGASHSRHLATEFHAIVDGTLGNTFLQDVVAHFDNTTAVFKGSVAGKNGQQGKTVNLDILSADGHIEDLLNLFIAAPRASMEGVINMRGHVELDPGKQPFVTRLKMEGDFGVEQGKFVDPAIEADLTRLSNSAKKPKDAPRPDATRVLSDVQAHFSAAGGTALLSRAAFSVPGAKATLHGTYRLTDYKLDLHGTLSTTGKPSDATTGFKSVLVSAITPFFKRKHSEKIVPIKITGTYGNTAIGLDLSSKKK